MNFRLAIILISLLGIGYTCLAMNKRNIQELYEDQDLLEQSNLAEDDDELTDVDPESEKAQDLQPSKKQAVEANQEVLVYPSSSYSNIERITPPSAAIAVVALQEKANKRTHRKQLKCPHCSSVQIFNQAKLAEHIKANHPGKALFSCMEPGCSQGYSNRRSLARHYNTDHLGKRFACEECSQSFKYAHHLASHKDAHKPGQPPLKPYKPKELKCPHCASGQIFQQNALAEHIKIHHIDKMPFPCMEPGCSQGYNDRHSLARHKRRTHEYDQLLVAHTAKPSASNVAIQNPISITTNTQPATYQDQAPAHMTPSIPRENWSPLSIQNIPLMNIQKPATPIYVPIYIPVYTPSPTSGQALAPQNQAPAFTYPILPPAATSERSNTQITPQSLVPAISTVSSVPAPQRISLDTGLQERPASEKESAPTQKKIPCPHCSSGALDTFNQDDLAQHIKTTHPWANNPIICMECSKGFKNRTALASHQKTHGKGLFTCNKCSETFKYERRLAEHIKSYHQE